MNNGGVILLHLDGAAKIGTFVFTHPISKYFVKVFLPSGSDHLPVMQWFRHSSPVLKL